MITRKVLPGGRREGLKEHVSALDLLPLHQVVHKGRFAHISVAHQRHHGDAAAPLLCLILPNLAEPRLLLDFPPDLCLLVTQLSSL